MADRKPSSREIEREVERERAELRGTVEELMDRFSFEELWSRAGAYMRDNRSDLGRTFGRTLRDKPLAVALTAVGLGWLFFGPAQKPPRSTTGRRRDPRDRTRRRLEEAGFADRSARGPAGAHAEADPWTAPGRGPAETPPARSGSGDRDAAVPGHRPVASDVPGPTGGPGATGAAVPARGPESPGGEAKATGRGPRETPGTAPGKASDTPA